MIRLNRAATPVELDGATSTALTSEFVADTSKSVWNLQYVKDGLLASSHNKCAYCEAIIIEESKYLEVEHFRCKRDFPDKVVEWENLLPSCKRCNGKKGDHNVDKDGMIVNPYQDDIKEYLYFQNYRFRWRNEVGRNSIEVLYINDTERLVSVRMKVGNAIAVSLEDTRKLLEEYLAGQNSTRRRNRILGAIESLLQEAQPTAQYSALAATVILTNKDYLWLCEQIDLLGLWSLEFASLHAIAQTLALIE